MFRKTSCLRNGYIAQALSFLHKVVLNEFGHYTKDEVDGAREGLACLINAKPEYLLNLIPQDHPDRIMAVRLLTEEKGK